MAETVAESTYQQLHHMFRESEWERRDVRRQLIADANIHFGYSSAVLMDASGLTKKGQMSADSGTSAWGSTENVSDDISPTLSRTFLPKRFYSTYISDHPPPRL